MVVEEGVAAVVGAFVIASISIAVLFSCSSSDSGIPTSSEKQRKTKKICFEMWNTTGSSRPCMHLVSRRWMYLECV